MFDVIFMTIFAEITYRDHFMRPLKIVNNNTFLANEGQCPVVQN